MELEKARAELARVLNGGQDNNVHDRAFLLDVSTSMSGMKLEEAKRALLKNAKDEDLVITFGTDVHTVPKSMVSGLFVQGDTAMLPAIQQAVDMKVSHMILITDGWANIGGNSFDVIDFVATLTGVKIDTIGIGNDCDHVMLRQISTMTKGGNYKVDDPMQLNGVVGMLSAPKSINL